MKNSFSIFELILTILVSSIVFIYSTQYIKELFYTNKNLEQIEIQKLDMLATKAFLSKQDNIYEKLSYQDKNLYFENNILLEDVSSFSISKEFKTITITININDNIKQEWKFKNDN